jgi:hypothetical protein
MDNETDVTREQMDETRASLSEQLETLGQRAVDTAQGAADVVALTVDNVRDAVNETVENVKDTFDLPRQLTRHPWVMLGGSIALGCLGGYLLSRRGAPQPSANGRTQPARPDRPGSTEKQNGLVKDPRFQVETSGTKPVQDVASAALDEGWRFGAEINKVKGLAIGTVLGVVRDMITQSAFQSMKAGLEDVIDGLTVKLGGEPIHGPVLKHSTRADGQDARHSSAMERPMAAAQGRCQTAGTTGP